MTRTAHEAVKVFCSYSHRDESYLKDLRTWLTGLERQGLIEEWHDREIVPGQEWEEAIEENLKTSEIILLLVTPDFVNSDYSFEKEMTPALERHDRGETRVIPIIVRPAYWEWAPFGKLQALPKDAKPITTWTNQDEAWLDVVKGIRKAVEELQGTPAEHKQEAASTQQGAEHIQPPGDQEKEDLLRRYREGVELAWADKRLNRDEAEWLRDLANRLGISPSTAAEIEREIMGDTIEVVLEEDHEGVATEPVSQPLMNPYDYTAYILDRYGPGSRSGSFWRGPGRVS